MTFKRIALFAALLSFFVLCFIGYERSTVLAVNSFSLSGNEVNKNGEVAPGATTKPSQSHSVLPEYKSAISYEKFGQEVAELTKNNVLGMGRENSDYAVYSDEDLERMGDAGDIVALKMLAVRLSDRAQSTLNSEEFIALVKRGLLLREKAIVYGDKEFFLTMPGLSHASSLLVDINSTPEQKHEAALDILAHQEFFGLRGSMKLKYREQSEAFETYKDYGFPATLTESDKKTVREKAQIIYKEYERKRFELGLGEFDNSIPDEMAKSYQFEKQYYEIRMGANAI